MPVKLNTAQAVPDEDARADQGPLEEGQSSAEQRERAAFEEVSRRSRRAVAEIVNRLVRPA
jgi:hypothetical protein